MDMLVWPDGDGFLVLFSFLAVALLLTILIEL
jgi:hypothetical protein